MMYLSAHNPTMPPLHPPLQPYRLQGHRVDHRYEQLPGWVMHEGRSWSHDWHLSLVRR